MATSSDKSSLQDMAVDTAKDLAPWRSGLDWWVVLIEGIVVGLVGLVMLIFPSGTYETIAVIFTAALLVAGILQLWSLFRNRAPESVDTLVSARASIAVFAGVVILLLYFFLQEHLTWQVGLITVGLACLVYGLLGLALIVRWKGARRQNAIIETIFFTAVGVLMLYTQVGGPGAVATAVRVIAWLSLLTGAGLIAFAFFRRSKEEEYEAAVEKVSTTVETQKKKLDSTADDAAKAVKGTAQNAGDAAKDVAGDLSDAVTKATDE